MSDVPARPLTSPVTVDPETPVKEIYSVKEGVKLPFESTLSTTSIPGIEVDACKTPDTEVEKVMVAVSEAFKVLPKVLCIAFCVGTLYKFGII